MNQLFLTNRRVVRQRHEQCTHVHEEFVVGDHASADAGVRVLTDPDPTLKVIPVGNPIKVYCGCGVILPRAAPKFDITMEWIDQRSGAIKKQIVIPP